MASSSYRSSSRALRIACKVLGELPRRHLSSAVPSSSAFASTSTATWPAPRQSRPRQRCCFELCIPLRRSIRRRYATSAPETALEDLVRPSSVRLTPEDGERLSRQRNIGISAHIDSGKTTLTERVLFYTGRIKAIHEVRGKDQVGAKMDSMELEREKGITIQSAATYCDWPLREQVDPTVAGDYHINIIDTPGHVDFTIEVERALRVLDGAVLVLCAVSGVQSQTITVDRQMKRYKVPRVAFVNKMDRQGANPWRVVKQIREKLQQPAAAMQVPIGANDDFSGVFDLVKWKAIRYEGESGIDAVESDDVPADVLELAKQKRVELIETLADVDETIADLFLEEKEITGLDIYRATRRATINRRFMPVYMGTALGNKGVQTMLDGVCTYLPAPNEVDTSQLVALNVNVEPNTRHELVPANKAPLVALAFKLEESKFGQLTYMRVYQGQIKRAANLVHVRTGKKIKIPRLVRMHSNEMEEVNEIGAGEICALYGVDCATGDTFTDGAEPFSMTSMFVPEPVVSLSIRPKGSESPNFSKALSRFVREDPTFRVHVDAESSETIIRGMGELHLEIYVERMRREYGVETVTGRPQVNYRETIMESADYNMTYRRQSGGRGEFAKIIGRIEPIDTKGINMEFVNETIGGVIDKGFMTATRKGFEDGMRKGELIGHPVENVRFVVTDGAMHPVDSSEFAFRHAGATAFAEAYMKAGPVILEPVMKVSVTSPNEYQGSVISTISARKGTIVDTEQLENDFTCHCEISLGNMFGYITNLRAATQGKGEFTMEFDSYRPVTPDVQAQLMKDHRQFSGGAASAGQASEKRRETSGKQGALRGH